MLYAAVGGGEGGGMGEGPNLQDPPDTDVDGQTNSPLKVEGSVTGTAVHRTGCLMIFISFGTLRRAYSDWDMDWMTGDPQQAEAALCPSRL
jgi:hypothetical protein